MDQLVKDIQLALRNLRRHPAFASTAVMTIALGIGATTAIFSVVDAALLRDLPYSSPEQLVRVWSSNAERGIERGYMSPPDIADYQEQNQTLTDLAAYAEAELAMIDRDGSATKVTGTWAGGNLFSVLGAVPLIGRTLTPEDGLPGAPKVLVLSHLFWQSRFGADPGVLSTAVTVEENSYTVVGVMPPGFDFPGKTNFWLNRHLLSYPGRYARWMDVVGRLKPGVDLEAARSELSGIAARLAAEYPNWNREYGTTVLSLHEAVAGDTRPTLLVLLGATTLLLLIACVNVVNLLLARLTDRGREIALRAALGAGRWRISRQLLTESLVLAFAGAVVGTLLAGLGISLLRTFGPADLPRLDEAELNGRVLVFALGATLVAGLVFGLAPAWRLARTDVSAELQEGGRSATAGAGRERFRSLLVVTEIALAVMVTAGAGLLARSFAQLQATDPGFNPMGVLTFQVDLPTGAYRDLQAVAGYHASLAERLSRLAGVQSVAATATLPFDAEVPFLGNFFVEGRPTPRQGEEPQAHYRQVTPGYFSTLGIGLVDGREFDTRDHREAPGAAVVDETLARRYFPNENPIGKTIVGLPPHLALGGFLVNAFTIVGVVRDVRYFGLGEAPRPSLYLPVAQAPFRQMRFLLSTARPTDGLMSEVRRELMAVDPAVPVSRVATMEQILSRSVSRERFSVFLLTLLAAVALGLATVGIYGVISYSVSQRKSELGIRMAVGADAADVLSLVLRQGARLTAWGVAIGLASAAAFGRVLSSQLYGVSFLDPVTFVSVGVGLSAVAMTACYLPAARAAGIDPALALRGEGREAR